ncbi:GTPase, partial [Ursidibacter sp. B-7004-1]
MGKKLNGFGFVGILLYLVEKSGLLKKTPDFLIDKIPLWFEQLKNWWNGKNIAILGATATGKNSLFNRLCGYDINTDYEQTRGTEKIKNFKFTYKISHSDFSGIIELKCKNSTNTGGEIDERDRYWFDIASKADIIFYLIDI